MLGPSGSGKTTVLRMIAGFEAPTAGRVFLDGHGRDRPGAVRAQRQHRLPGLRAVPAPRRARQRRVRPGGQEGAARASAASGPRRRWSRCGWAGTATAGPASSPAASGSASPSPGRWSTGPQVLLLDEPLGALDLKLRREMQIELKQLQRDVGITFVFVTHDQEEALTMSDRIAVFNDGRIEQVATPAELYEAPASSFVAGFVGTSNLLTGEAARARARPRGHVLDPAREDPPRRHRRGRRPARPGHRRGRGGRLPRLGQPLRRRARRRRHPHRAAAEPARHLRPGGRTAATGSRWLGRRARHRPRPRTQAHRLGTPPGGKS